MITNDKPCIYCGDINHEAKEPSPTCLRYLQGKIDKMESEHAALAAVAEAAESACNTLSTIRSGLNATSGYIDDMVRAKSELADALANLAALRGQKGE